MLVVVRDDDISYFTPAPGLHQLYGILWDKGCPVSLSVIPFHNDSVAVPYRSSRPKPDENTPRAEWGRGRTRRVADNAALVQCLADLVDRGLVELAVHGCEHTYLEFSTDDSSDLSRRLDVALAGLHEAFPRAAVATFVPPHDRLSQAAVEVLRARGLHLCTCWGGLPAAVRNSLSATGQAPSPFCVLSAPGLMVLVAEQYVFDPLYDERRICEVLDAVVDRKPELLVLVNHYWSFFRDFGRPIAWRQRLWRDTLDRLLSSGAEFCTIRGAIERCRHKW